MPEVTHAGADASGIWKKLFLVLSIAIVILMPLVSRDYGQSGDEWLQIEYGEHIRNYHNTGDPQALSYENKSLQYRNLEYYGGIFDYSMSILHHAFPSIPILILRHFFNALVGAVMMIFTGLLARRISRKWSIGVLALLFIFFSPRIFGESMNNPKDIPFACGFIIAVYSFLALLQDLPVGKWRHAAGIALGFALSFGVRPAGGLLLIAYFGLFSLLYYFTNKEFKARLHAEGNKLLKTGILLLGGGIALGYIIGLLAWPWGLQDPLSNPFASLKQMTNVEVNLRVLFEGQYGMNFEMPWYYEFKWIAMSNPVIVLAGVAVFIVLAKKAVAKYGLFAASLVVFCAFFPLLYMIYKHSAVHDTWRHVFFVYTFWVVIAALGFDMLTTLVRNEKWKMVPVYIAMAGLIPTMVWTVRSHPNQYVYFNEFAGGPSGAFGYYDLDYYQNTGKQAADWIRENVKPIPGRKVVVRSNMVGFDKYFAKDTSWIVMDYGRYNERHHLEWDYYVAYPRYVPVEQLQNGLWPPQNVVHTVEIDGVPLSVVLQNKSTAGRAAHEAYGKEDFPTAIRYYEEYLKTDNSDEYVYVNYGLSLAYTGQIDAAINAIKKATELNPGSAEYFNLLGKLYTAKGDNANAQQAQNRANEISLRQQGY